MRLNIVADARQQTPDQTGALPASNAMKPGLTLGSFRIRSPDGVIGSGSRSLSRNPSERSEEHTSELQSLMRISYAVFCLKKKQPKHKITQTHRTQTIQHHNNTTIPN